MPLSDVSSPRDLLVTVPCSHSDGCVRPSRRPHSIDRDLQYLSWMNDACVQTTNMADVDGDRLILRVETDDKEVLPVEPIQEFFHECIAVIRLVDGSPLIADAPFFD